MTLAPGTTLGPYQIVRQLGSGGMGVVYEARDPRLKRTVAIKLLPPDLTRDETAKQRFLQEAQAASALDHPNICTIFEINETDDGQLYLVMAHYEGETLKERIERGPLELDDAIDIATQVGQGLAEAHGAGIVHRDIKPANLLATKTGVVKILDFGLAKLAGTEGVTQTGTTLGTVAYMSPEQSKGQEVDHRTDIWSLGVVLYEMLAGEPPFQGENLLSLADAIRSTEPEPVTGPGSSLNGALSRAMSKDVSRRHQQVTELLSDLVTGSSEPSAPPRVSAEPDIPSIAVLPFDNLSDQSDDYFADGLTEDIITNLSRFRELRVIARTSMFRFKGLAIDLSRLRTELGVGYVVEGSVRRAGGRVRITAQLIDAGSQLHLWADKYDREMEDIFAVQDEVTQTIAAALGVTIQDVALQRALSKNPTDFDAYDCLLRARRYTTSLSADMHAEARDLLERAVALDPTYADAYALLANVYLAEHRFDTNPRPDPIGRALKAAQTATRLDPQNAYVRCWLAICHFFRRENDLFEAEAQRALNLNPNDPETLADLGHYLAFMGQFERGVALTRRAQQLNPLHPGWLDFAFARYHYDRGEYADTLAAVQRAAMPHFYWTHLLNAAALGQLKRAEAGDALASIYALKPDFSARVELEKWNAAADDLEHLLDGLRKAGVKE